MLVSVGAGHKSPSLPAVSLSTKHGVRWLHLSWKTQGELGERARGYEQVQNNSTVFNNIVSSQEALSITCTMFSSDPSDFVPLVGVVLGGEDCGVGGEGKHPKVMMSF